MNDIELKTHVDEQTLEDFLVCGRLLGFKSRSDFLRFIVLREVAGTLPQLQSNAPAYGLAGRKIGENKARGGLNES